MIESATRDRAVAVSTFIEASPATVFGILSDPARFSDWIQGEASFEPQAGSPFSVRFPQFETIVTGEIREIDANRRIVLTWGVSEGRQADWFPPGSSTVTIELAEEAGGTRVELTHDDLPENEVQPHHGGWRFHISRLDLKANREQLGELLGGTLRDWCAAWGEEDAEQRATILERCTSEDVSYADDYAALDGRDRLSLHIGNTQQYAPGSTLTTGDPRICRGEALVPWSVADDDENTVLSGTLHAEVDVAGRLTRITSFWAN